MNLSFHTLCIFTQYYIFKYYEKIELFELIILNENFERKIDNIIDSRYYYY